jgi:hypothetical protein
MPTFTVMSLEDAALYSATGTRAQITREYVGYINDLSAGQSGVLELEEGETVTTVKRRLSTAAKAARTQVTVDRVANNTIYFSVRRRGRPKKTGS